MKNPLDFLKKGKYDEKTKSGLIIASSFFSLIFVWGTYLIFDFLEMGGGAISYFLIYVILFSILLIGCIFYGCCLFCGILKGKKWKKR